MKNEVGNSYGMLTVERLYCTTRQGAVWLCKCDPARGGCGVEIAVDGVKLRSGNTRSCGCLRRMAHKDRAEAGYVPHGKERSVEYGV